MLHFWPFPLLFLLVLIGALAVLAALVELSVITYAYERLGLSARAVFALLGASLLGSAINIPVYRLPAEQMIRDQVVYFYGVPYLVPVVHSEPGTVVAVNVGGALVPALLALYLLLSRPIFSRALPALVLVTGLVYTLARPLPGVGIAVPIFMPLLATVLAAWLFGGDEQPAVAYVAGSLGTLIGADLLNVGHVQGLGAPVASIGGAGTFDGVFMVGLLSVLLVHRSLPSVRRAPRPPEDQGPVG